MGTGASAKELTSDDAPGLIPAILAALYAHIASASKSYECTLKVCAVLRCAVLWAREACLPVLPRYLCV